MNEEQNEEASEGDTGTNIKLKKIYSYISATYKQILLVLVLNKSKCYGK